MKATISFDLTDELDSEKFKEYASGNHENLKLAMNEFDHNILRGNTKHGVGPATKERILADVEDRLDLSEVIEATLQFVRTEFYEYLRLNNTSLD